MHCKATIWRQDFRNLDQLFEKKDSNLEGFQKKFWDDFKLFDFFWFLDRIFFGLKFSKSLKLLFFRFLERPPGCENKISETLEPRISTSVMMLVSQKVVFRNYKLINFWRGGKRNNKIASWLFFLQIFPDFCRFNCRRRRSSSSSFLCPMTSLIE